MVQQLRTIDEGSYEDLILNWNARGRLRQEIRGATKVLVWIYGLIDAGKCTGLRTDPLRRATKSCDLFIYKHGKSIQLQASIDAVLRLQSMIATSLAP
jgi:hypothetical protein